MILDNVLVYNIKLPSEFQGDGLESHLNKFDEKNLPKQVLYPLQDAGYIQLARGTKSHGRGAKPFWVK